MKNRALVGADGDRPRPVEGEAHNPEKMCAEFVGRPWGRPSEVADAGASGRSGGSSRLIHLPLTPRRGTRSGRVSLERGDADGSAGARSRLDPDGTQPLPRTLALNFFGPERAFLPRPLPASRHGVGRPRSGSPRPCRGRGRRTSFQFCTGGRGRSKRPCRSRRRLSVVLE